MLRDVKQPTFAELYSPKLITVLREGYGLADLRADVISGLTVAIVALPLSMAIAIASGVAPGRGLYTAVVGGFIVSLLGGSRFQVGGPAGAFIALVAVTADRYGIDGVILATLMAGVLLIAAGLLRLGTYIKFIPYPVTVGFTAGIAVIIFASQLKDIFGITLSGREPAELIPKLSALAGAAHTANASALVQVLVQVFGHDLVADRQLHPGGHHAGCNLEVDGVVGDRDDGGLQAGRGVHPVARLQRIVQIDGGLHCRLLTARGTPHEPAHDEQERHEQHIITHQRACLSFRYRPVFRGLCQSDPELGHLATVQCAIAAGRDRPAPGRSPSGPGESRL
jgi:hypothetical protein